MTKLGLFIDEGYQRCGYCIANLAKKEILNYGCIETKSNELIEDRIFNVFNQLVKKIEEETEHNNTLNLICIEEPCFNGKNGALLNRVVGAIYIIVGQHKTAYLTVNPKTLKLKLTGHGRASKNDMLFYVKKYFPALNLDTELDDCIDSIALYIVYLLNNKIINYVE